MHHGEEVLDPEVRPAGREGEEGVHSFHVGPTRRQRMDPLFSGPAEEHPMLPPAVGVAEQLELLAGEGMERVGDYESSPTFGIGCS